MKRNGQARRAFLRLEARKARFGDDEIDSILGLPVGERLLEDGIRLGPYNDVTTLPLNRSGTAQEKEASPLNGRDATPSETIRTEGEPGTIGDRIDEAFERHCERRTKEVKGFNRYGRRDSEFWRDFAPLRDCRVDDNEKAASLIVDQIEEMAADRMPRKAGSLQDRDRQSAAAHRTAYTRQAGQGRSTRSQDQARGE